MAPHRQIGSVDLQDDAGTYDGLVLGLQCGGERLERFAKIVGRERLMAGTDCGFGTFAGFGPVEPDIAYLKLKSLVEGAQLASRRLWG